MSRVYLKWEDTDFTWDNLDMQWQSVFVEIDRVVRRGGGYDGYVPPWESPWKKLKEDIGEEKTEKVIRLYCNINGIDYDETVKKGSDIVITASEFKRFVKNGISVKINFKK